MRKTNTKKKNSKNTNYTLIYSIILLVLAFAGIFLLNSQVDFTGFSILETSGETSDERVVENILSEVEFGSEFEYIPPENKSREAALEALLDAEDDLQEMIDFGLSVFFIEDSLLHAQRYYIGNDTTLLEQDIEQQDDELKIIYLESLQAIAANTPEHELEVLDYSEVFSLTQLIEFRKQQAYLLTDSLEIVEEKEQQYTADYVDTFEGLAMLNLAKESFAEERYDEAEEYLRQADVLLDQASLELRRLKKLWRMSTNLLVLYWWQTLLVLVFLASMGYFSWKKIRVILLINKIKMLKQELMALDELMVKAQKDYLYRKRISKQTYEIKMQKYKERKGEIKHTLPVLESILTGKKVEEKEPDKKTGVLQIKSKAKPKKK